MDDPGAADSSASPRYCLRQASSEYECDLGARGYERIAGVDEVGVGALAGPVVAAAVILPHSIPQIGLTDSKQLTARQREALYETITSIAIGWAVAGVVSEQVDSLNILQASHLAMRKALGKLVPPADFVLIDGRSIPEFEFEHQTIIGGDRLCCSIAAASIVAKVTRDRLMCELARVYPEYGFEGHKGYGSRMHRDALRKYGACTIHRCSYAPIKQLAQLTLDVGDEL